MPQAPSAFEPTNSWCYRFARYQAIPEILAMPEATSGQPFRLVDLSRRVLDTHLTASQQESKYRRAKSNQEISVAASVKFYIPFIAKNTTQLVRLGDGMYRVPTVDDVDEEAVEEEVEEAVLDSGEGDSIEFDGWIYAFSFPPLVRAEERFPIKIGKTGGDVDARVLHQCRSSAAFDTPVVLGRWQVNRVNSVEMAIHQVLKARGQWREQALGNEWFDAQPAEVESIIKFVTQT
jgi:hypothetical protein